MTFSYCQLKGAWTSDNQSGPRLWLVILDGRERCPTITVTPLMAVAYCSKNRSGYNPQLIDSVTLPVSVSLCIQYSMCTFVLVNMFVCGHVCVCERKREWGRAVCDLAPSTVSEGVTIRSPSHSSRQADCAANCGLGGWRPTDRMESRNTKEKQFGSSTQ